MNASSQTSPGALPPESPHGARPLPGPATPADTFAAYGAVLPVPLGSAAAVQRPGATADPDVPHGLMARVPEPATPECIDPECAESIAATAYQLGVDDTRAELERLGQDGEILPWFHARRKAVALLCEGRPDDHLLTVREVLTAADGRTPTDAPLTLMWNRSAQVPDAHTTHKQVVVECTTAHGGRADLVLQDEERFALASLLDAEIRDITTPCATSTACGTADDLDASDPMLFGWSRLEIAGIEGGPRWYCTPHCVSNALARASDDLAIIDDQAALDGGL